MIINKIALYIWKKPRLFFVLIWLLISILFEYYKIITLPPLSIHQGAQVDRASIALNYAEVSMNFIEPRVMETATHEGITSCEFPIINYTVAIMYKIFGYHPFLYRFLMWFLMGIGLWALFDILLIWLGNQLSATIICLTWYFSPILAFYTPNFLPDVASLSFLLLAFRQWYYYQNDFKRNRILLFLIFGVLASLIKITSLVFIITIFILSILQVFKKERKTLLIVTGIFIFLSVFSWYKYCKWLDVQVGGSYFLMQVVMPSSINEFKDWFHIFYANWFYQIYNKWQWILVLVGLCSIPFIKEKALVKKFSLIALIGGCLIYFLMSGQFRYHDYYIITLLPVFLFLYVFAFKWLNTFSPVLAYFLFLMAIIWGFTDTKTNFRLRYTKGSYLNQTYFEPSDFVKVDNWLSENGVNQQTRILTAFDPNPNNLLYFLHRRGCRAFDHDSNYISNKLKLYPNVVLTDTAKFFKQYGFTRKKVLHQSSFNNFHLYKLK